MIHIMEVFMSKQKVSLFSTIVYLLVAVSVFFLCIACNSSSGHITAQASEKGFQGNIVVEVQVLDGKIKAAKLIESGDSDFTLPAIKTILEQAVKNGNAENLDAVSGASLSSKATIQAIGSAFAQALKQEAEKAK